LKLEPIAVHVPATSANLGPGFDVLGLALPFYNRLTLAAAETLTIVNEGPEAAGLPTDETHLAHRAAALLCAELGKPVPAWRMTLDVQIPQSRGLGSSSAAIVAGLMAANAWFDSPLDTHGLLQLATRMEGHPDNVAPALYGGVTAAFTDNGVTHCVPLASRAPASLVAAIPDFHLATAEARKALPAAYSRADVVANLAAVTVLTTVMTTGAIEWLSYGLKDRIHQPYRLSLIPGADAVEAASSQAGALGLAISGAGPTLLAFCPSDARDGVAAAMREAWEEMGIGCRTLTFEALARGAGLGDAPIPG
jgi:homoserine kinase